MPTCSDLWQTWLSSKLLDEFNRVEGIKGQGGKGKRSMTAASDRRTMIDIALAECEAGRWLHINELGRFMRAAGLEFKVTRDPWHLYVGDARYGSLGHQGWHGWDVLEGRFLRCLLFEYAATLGMVDVAFTRPEHVKLGSADIYECDDLLYLSRYDGFEYFRVNELGSFILRGGDDYAPSQSAPASRLSVRADLRVGVAGPLSPEKRVCFELWARPISEDVWQIDRDKTLQAIENGHSAGDLRDFLAELDDQPLPEQIEGPLRGAERSGMRVRSPSRAMRNWLSVRAPKSPRKSARTGRPGSSVCALRTRPCSLRRRSGRVFSALFAALGWALAVGNQ